MKKVFKLSFILLALLGVMFTSCKKDYPEPPIQVLPIGTIYTIDSILNMESGTVFNEDASVYGIVTADEKSGNLYKAAFIQDRATGAAIELYLNATSGLRIGDSIRVYLKDVTYTEYNGLPQLSNFEADGHIVILANDRDIQPAEVTIADVVAGKYRAGLVKLSNVMFTEKNTFAEPTTYGNRTLVDPSDFSKSVIVRTSNYANFANDSLPQGIGSLVAIASVYNSTWQLLIRSAKELEFSGYTPSGDGNVLPYYQDFVSSFGTYSTFDVKGSQSWEIDYSTAKMTGYIGGNNYENEDWLISAPVSFEGVTQVSMTMKYIARYFSNLNEDITIQVSTDFTSGDPTQATWTQVPAVLTEGSNWTDFLTASIDLSQFAGQKVVVAVKYMSNSTKAGTIEIQSILLQEGGGDTPPTPPGPAGEVQSVPYSQSFATEFGSYTTFDALGSQSWMIDYSTAKMTGYVSSTNYANEDWLISSPVDLSGLTEAKITMVYIGRYFTNINNDITFWVSTDYTFNSDPATATWTQLSSTLTEGSNWSDFLTAEISLTPYVGQTVTIAVKYVSTDVKAGTIEIQSLTIQEGSAGGGGITPPGTVTGDGSRENPYTADDIIILGITTSDGNKYWVKDHIAGYIDASYDYQFSAEGAVASNITLAKADFTSSADCVPIQLPVGAVRNGLNLADNPANLGQEVLLYGTLENYFKAPGVKNVTYAELGGNSFGTDPGYVPPTPTGEVQELPYTQSFTEEFGTYWTYDVSGAQSWMIDYSTAKMTGYVNSTNNANEDWLISSPVNITGVNNAKMTMVYIARYFNNLNNDVTVWASTNYTMGNEPASATWTQVPSTLTEGSNWTDFITTEIALTDYVNQTVYFAVKYVSTSEKAGTIEIQSITIEEDGETPPTPPTPPTGEVQELPYTQSFTTEFGTYLTYDVSGAQSWMIDYSTAKMTGYVNSTNNANEDWLISSPVNMSGVNNAKMTMVYIARFFNNVNNDVTIWASTDYTWGNEPASATWTQVPSTLSEGSNWNDFKTAEFALTDYVGQTVYFAVKYVSTSEKAGTIEIQSIAIEEDGETPPTPPTPPTPGTPSGTGTADDPYNVAAGIEAQNQEIIGWTQGYIVGVVKTGVLTIGSNDDVNWAAPFENNTNVVIADDPTCNEIENCIIVNLPNKKPLRTEVNLVDHPENLGKLLKVKGKLRAYFGKAGLRDSNGSSDDFVLEDAAK